jgi:hypothetical protein
MAGSDKPLPVVDMTVDKSFRHYFIMQATSLLGCAPCGNGRSRPCGPAPEPAAARKRRPAARDELSAGALEARERAAYAPQEQEGPERSRRRGAPQPAGDEPEAPAAPAPARRPAPTRVVVKPSIPLPGRQRSIAAEYDELDAMVPGGVPALFKRGGSWAKPAPPPRPVKASAIFGDAVLDGGPVDGCGL